MKASTAFKRLIEEYRSRPTQRAGSLITTIFGDAIAPRGGKVWLGSLIDAVADFGINERSVRTSVFRLVRDDWLQSEQIGRRSYYSLSEEGRQRFEQATQRIYSSPTSTWDGRWCLLLLSGLDTDRKERVRKECAWLGFGALSANVLAHPDPDMNSLDRALQRLAVADALVVLGGQTLRNESGMRRIAHQSWNLAEIDLRYGEFVQYFRPLLKSLREDNNLKDKQAFMTRTLLIQEYRKILLRDPLLPTELLPANWHGQAAYQLVRNLYQMLYASADRFVTDAMQTADGPLPPVSASFMLRFGGLQTNASEN